MRTGVEVAAIASSPPSGFGAGASVFRAIAAPIALQLSGGARFGEIPSAQATFAAVQIGGGGMWRAMRSSSWRPFEVDLRADVFVTDLVLHRSGASQSRWVPEGRVECEGSWFFAAPNAALVLAAGIEATVGTTDVAVGNDIVATIRPFRAVAALGGRVGF
jgi:hypothetical protein